MPFLLQMRHIRGNLRHSGFASILGVTIAAALAPSTASATDANTLLAGGQPVAEADFASVDLVGARIWFRNIYLTAPIPVSDNHTFLVQKFTFRFLAVSGCSEVGGGGESQYGSAIVSYSNIVCDITGLQP